MGGKFRQRKAIRRWVTRDDPVSAEVWHGRTRPTYCEYYGWWDQNDAGGDGGCDLLLDRTLKALGVRVPRDRPVLVEFTARVVEEGSDE